MRDIKFLSYDGSYPNLCSGTLCLEIDGNEIHCRHCLSSGGSAGVDFSNDYEEYCTTGDWTVDFESLEENLPDGMILSDEDKKIITELVNEEVPHGCCGGCI